MHRKRFSRGDVGSEACDAEMNDSPVDCQNRGGTERRSVRIIVPYKCQ